MKLAWLILLIILIPDKGSTAEIQFSEQAKLYLLTTSPGESIDQSWGHSAIWFVDSLEHIDFVFEYTSTEGSSSVSTIKMLFGNDVYQLRATNLEKYKSEIPEQHQTISYQLLSEDKSKIEPIYSDLVTELKQRKKYSYSLSSLNCSTLIFDHIHSLCKQCDDLSNESVRDIFRSDGQLYFWQELFIIDILPSSNADNKPSQLNPITPQYLGRLFLAETKIEKSNPFDFRKSLSILFCPILAILLSLYAPKVYLVSLFLISSLIATVLTITFFRTDELLFQNNHQLLWLNPLYFLGLIIQKKRIRYYLLLLITVLFVVSIIISLLNGHIGAPLLVTFSSILIGNIITLKKNFSYENLSCITK